MNWRSARQHLLDQGETSARLILTRYWSGGRGYRDQPPGRLDFLPLRQARLLADWFEEYAHPN